MPIITLKTTDINNKFEKTVINYTNPTIDEMQEIINDIGCYRKAMNKYDTRKRKQNWLNNVIPSDIFLNFIIPRTNLNSLNLLSQVNKYFNKKSSRIMHHNTYIRYDPCLRKAMVFHFKFNQEILKIIAKSSFSFEQFDTLYFNIKSQKTNIPDMRDVLITIAKNVMIENKHNNQIYLNNNFKIFQILKRFSREMKKERKTEKEKIDCLLTYGLHYYMHILYFKRNGKLLNNELIIQSNLKYISYLDININFPMFSNLIMHWDYHNINIYNIYETMNLMRDNKHHYDQHYLDNIFESTVMDSNSNYYSYIRIKFDCEFIIDTFQVKDEFTIRKHGRTVIKYIPWHYLFKYVTLIYDKIGSMSEDKTELINFMKRIYNQANFIKNEMKKESKTIPREFKLSILTTCNTVLRKLEDICHEEA
jgi:hypothetical protein